MITKHENLCLICSAPAVDRHHCLKGVKQRRLADEDDLLIPLCRSCHEQVHKRKELNVLVEIIGQLSWERDQLISNQELPFDDLSEAVREDFRIRYGRSYI
jgi:hypothetical protein